MGLRPFFLRLGLLLALASLAAQSLHADHAEEEAGSSSAHHCCQCHTASIDIAPPLSLPAAEEYVSLPAENGKILIFSSPLESTHGPRAPPLA